MRKILFVDDEKDILKAIRRAFVDTEYDLYFAESGKEALEFLLTQPVDIVISDMRMPEMDGYNLLKQVKKQYPHVLRIILSGYSDDTILIKSLKENVAKLYLFKPWNNDELLQIISNLFETENQLNNNKIFETINNFDSIPTLEANYLRLIRMIDDGEDTNKVVKEIERNQALTLNILKIANSAYYNLKAISVFKAVTYLGVNNIRNIIQATAVVESFVVDKQLRKHIENIWEVCTETTHILNFINKKHLKLKDFDMLFTAGLLHHIGMAVIIFLFKDKYIEFLKQAKNQSSSTIEALEISMFGYSNNQMGGFMLKWWDLPFPVVEAAFYYNKPQEPSIINKSLVKAIYIADYYARQKIGLDDNSGIIIQAFDDLGIEKTLFESDLKEYYLRNEAF